MEKYNYQTLEKDLKFSSIKLLPLKVEIKLLKKIILSLRLKEILTIPYYWLKRVRLMKRDIYENVDLPEPMGK